LLATFAEDALVNDQLRDYWGKPIIREWAKRDIIGERLTMNLTKLINHYGTEESWIRCGRLQQVALPLKPDELLNIARTSRRRQHDTLGVSEIAEPSGIEQV
jgi:hypothetical protein